MKKIKSQLCLGFLISTYTILHLTIQSNAATGTISTETIRLRKEPSTTSGILELISSGTKVEVLSEEDGWYKVTYNGITGYLNKEYVSVEGEITSNSKDEEQQPAQENENNSGETDNQENSNQEENNPDNSVDTIPQLHLLPLMNSTVMYEIKNGDTVNTLQEMNNWSRVEVNGITGWVITQHLSSIATQQEGVEPNNQDTQTEHNTTTPEESEENNEENSIEESNNNEETTKEAYINSEQVNFRKEASTDSEILDILKLNTKVEVIDTQDEWSKIKFNNIEGYIATRLLSDTKVEITSRSAESRTTTTTQTTNSEQNTNKENTSSTDNSSNNANSTATSTSISNSSKKSELVEYAKTFLGCKYVYGGSTPNGFDCSGFTQYVYKHFGYSISRSSSAQSKNGTYVEKANLQVGDLIFFSNYKTYQGIGHVGIYIGNHQFIHASSEKTGVIISSLNSSNYQKRYVTARRIF